MNLWLVVSIESCHLSGAVPGSNPGGVGHRDFSRGY